MSIRNPIIVFITLIVSACTSTIITPDEISAIPTQTFIPVETKLTPPTPTSLVETDTTALVSTEKTLNELLSGFPGACQPMYITMILKSPDEKWLAEDCTYDSLKVIQSGGSISWAITYKEIFGKSPNFPYNQGGIQPLHWTKDSQYLYFSAYTCCWDPPFLLLSSPKTIYILDVRNGEYGTVRDGFFNFSISPTDRRITFIEELQSPLKVEIQDVKLGSTNLIELEISRNYKQAAVELWSVDGLQFVIKAAAGEHYYQDIIDPDQFSLIVIDVENLTQKIILRDYLTTELNVLEWTDDDVLIFQTGGGFISEPVRTWQYNLITNILSEAVTTP